MNRFKEARIPAKRTTCMAVVVKNDDHDVGFVGLGSKQSLVKVLRDCFTEGEVFAFFFHADQRQDVVRSLVQFACNGDLNLTWNNAAAIGREVIQLTETVYLESKGKKP